MATTVLLVVEIGSHVGLGHVVRASILKQLITGQFDIDLWIVNREGWDNPEHRERYLPSRQKYNIVAADGLNLLAEISSSISYDRLISLSYMSDINSSCDYVVAPALYSTKVPENYITDLRALIFRQPNPEQLSPTPSSSKGARTAYVSFGGTNIDGAVTKYSQKLGNMGFKLRACTTYSGPQDMQKFIEGKLNGSARDMEPSHPGAIDADLILSQRGLSSIELSLQKTPMLLRNRNGFGPAYRFLENLPWVFFVSDDNIEAGLRHALNYMNNPDLSGDEEGREVYNSLAGNNIPRRDFWVNLLGELTDGQ